MDDKPGQDGPPDDDSRLQKLAGNMRGMMEAAGVEPPDAVALTAGYLNVGGDPATPPQVLANQVADALRGKNLLFRRGNEIGTINLATGQWEAMNAHRFCTWLPGAGMLTPVSGFWKSNAAPMVAGLGVENARLILASDVLRVKLPVVERINRVRLPVFRQVMHDAVADKKKLPFEKVWTEAEAEAQALDERNKAARKGFRKIELLPVGYDLATKTFTASAGNFDENLDPNEAMQWLLHLLRDFQWGDEIRSKSVFVQAFLTIFCRGLYLGKAPLFLFTSNLPGSGKSMLTRLCIEPVVGIELSGASGWNREDRQEVRKELDATAQAFSQHLWFDDVDRCKVVSQDLNRWLTSKTHRCRVMGGKEMFNGPLFAATFMTGNALTVDDNLERRTLWVDLFARQQARERARADDRLDLDEEFLENEANMQQCLAVAWALVRWWDEYDRPLTKQRPVESFENWSKVVASIAECAGFASGLKPYESPDSGNQEGREWRLLTTALIQTHCVLPASATAVVTMREVIRCARLNGLLVETLWSLDQVRTELDQLHKTKKFDWREVEVAFEDGVGLRHPEEHEKRLQAAEWTNRAMDSAFGKAFKKAALAGQWFQGSDGKTYEFGKRGDGKLASQFVIRALGTQSTVAT